MLDSLIWTALFSIWSAKSASFNLDNCVVLCFKTSSCGFFEIDDRSASAQPAGAGGTGQLPCPTRNQQAPADHGPGLRRRLLLSRLNIKKRVLLGSFCVMSQIPLEEIRRGIDRAEESVQEPVWVDRYRRHVLACGQTRNGRSNKIVRKHFLTSAHWSRKMSNYYNSRVQRGDYKWKLNGRIRIFLYH